MGILSNLRSGTLSKLPLGPLAQNRPRLTVAVRGGQLKLLIFDRQRVVWGRVIPLNPAYLEGGMIAQPRAVSGALRSALEQSPFPKIAEGVGAVAGYHALASIIDVPTRDFTPEQIIPREARRLFSYRPESSSLGWWPLRNRDGARRFVFVVTRRAAMQSMRDLFSMSELRLTALDSDPIATARAANIEEGVVVQAESDGGDVVVIKNGTVGLVRSAFWGGDIVDQESLSARVVDLVDRAIVAHNEGNPSGPLNPQAPLLLCGAGAGLLGTQVAEAMGREPGAFEPPLDLPDDFEMNELASNLGMVLRWVR